MKKLLFFAALSGILLLFSCSGQRDRGLREMNNIVYKLTPYKSDDPRALAFKLVLSEKGNGKRIAEWFKPANYNKLIYYVNKQLAVDLKLKQDAEEFSPAMVYLEPNMKITNRLIFLVAFDNIKPKDGSSFEFDDNLFNNGTIKFNIDNHFNS